MNKELIIQRFSKASASYTEEATVQRQIAATMLSLLQQYIHPEAIKKILEIGCGTGLFTRLLLRWISPDEMLLNDICPNMSEQLKDITNDQIRFEPGDAETSPFPSGFNMIVSCSAIQWFKAPEAFFSRISPFLQNEGILAFTTFGKDNIREVTSLTAQGLAYLSLEDLKEKLSPHYNILHASEDKIIKPFSTPTEVLYHLKRTGVTGLHRQNWTKASLRQFCEEYNRRYQKGNEVTLTYHPIYIIAKKKDL